ncbi:hypothetical protein, partial [Rhodococcus sp. BS-15]|uniref:hypothetical protein n=1 Tax=Rhodococcus sp. BS-15 TaxID=1304954 RepID=UPI001F242C88
MRASNQDVSAGEFSANRIDNAARDLRSSSPRGTTMPPARRRAAIVCSVFAPLGHGSFLIRI